MLSAAVLAHRCAGLADEATCLARQLESLRDRVVDLSFDLERLQAVHETELEELRNRARALDAILAAPPLPPRDTGSAAPSMAAAASASEPVEVRLASTCWSSVPVCNRAAVLNQRVRQTFESGGVPADVDRWHEAHLVLEPGSVPHARRGIYRDYSAFGQTVRDASVPWPSPAHYLSRHSASESARCDSVRDAVERWFLHFGMDADDPPFFAEAYRW